MLASPGTTIPGWGREVEGQPWRELTEDLQSEVCILGTGIAGLTAGLFLARDGHNVSVIEDRPLGSEHVAPQFESFLTASLREIETAHGENATRQWVRALTAATRQVEEICGEEGIDCDFERVDGYLFEGGARPPEALFREQEAAHRAGLETEMIHAAPTPFSTGLALCFPQQAQFDTERYRLGLLRAIEQRGGRLFRSGEGLSFQGGTPCRLSGDDGPAVTCERLVMGRAHADGHWPAYHDKLKPMRHLTMGFAIPVRSVEPVLVSDGHRLIRMQRGQSCYPRDFLVVQCERFEVRGASPSPRQLAARLVPWVREHYGMAEEVEFEYAVDTFEAVDRWPCIGRFAFETEGHYLSADTDGAVAGMVLAELALNRESPWEKLFEPARLAFARPAAA